MCRIMEDWRDELVKESYKQGHEEGHEEGREGGCEEGREEGIRALISTIKDFGLDKEAATQKLAQKFEISLPMAQEKVSQYWGLTI